MVRMQIWITPTNCMTYPFHFWQGLSKMNWHTSSMWCMLQLSIMRTLHEPGQRLVSGICRIIYYKQKTSQSVLFIEWRMLLPSERLNIGGLEAATSEAFLYSALQCCSIEESWLTEVTLNNLLSRGMLIVIAPFGFSYRFGQYMQGKYEFENRPWL